MQDTLVLQKNTWWGVARSTQDMFILNLHKKITQLLDKQHSIQQEQREGFVDDNEAVYTELKHQLGNRSLGYPALLRQIPIDTHVAGKEGLDDSQNRSQETKTSLDRSQTSIKWELKFLDSDPGSNDGRLENAGGAGSSQMSNPLSLCQEDSESREVGPRGAGALVETSGQQDGVNTTTGAYMQVVGVGRFNFLCSKGRHRSWGNKGDIAMVT